MMILNFSLRVIFCRLADVFGIAKEELKKMLDILTPFKNDTSKDSFSDCMAIPLY